MNRRSLFKFLGALPLLAIVPKSIWKTNNPLLLDGHIAYKSGSIQKFDGWYIGPNQTAKYRYVGIREAINSELFRNYPGNPKI